MSLRFLFAFYWCPSADELCFYVCVDLFFSIWRNVYSTTLPAFKLCFLFYYFFKAVVVYVEVSYQIIALQIFPLSYLFTVLLNRFFFLNLKVIVTEKKSFPSIGSLPT